MLGLDLYGLAVLRGFSEVDVSDDLEDVGWVDHLVGGAPATVGPALEGTVVRLLVAPRQS